MTEISKFWNDIQIAYAQVATNNDRRVSVTSENEGLTADVMYDTVDDTVVVKVYEIKREGDANA